MTTKFNEGDLVTFKFSTIKSKCGINLQERDILLNGKLSLEVLEVNKSSERYKVVQGHLLTESGDLFIEGDIISGYKLNPKDLKHFNFHKSY